MFKYTKEQLWDLYKQLPKDLQRATFSEEIGQKIRNVCLENKVTEDDLILGITKTVGYVFLGLLSPNKFSSILQQELKVEKEVSDRITAEITAEVFFSLKETLEALYEIKIENPKIPPKKVLEKNKDTYREPIS